MDTSDNDKELVKRAKQGDRVAFDALVTKYQYRVINLVGRFVKDEDEAQDVAQEAFIKAYRGLANFRGDSTFYTWLYQVVINSAKNYIVSKSRKTPPRAIDIEEAEHMGAASMKELDTPEGHMLTEEIERVVWQAIQELQEDLKTAITLREIDGMTYEEIASVMDCPVGTVRSRIFRARAAIDKYLKPLLY